MRVELAGLNNCAVPFLSRTTANLLQNTTIQKSRGEVQTSEE